MQKYRLRVGLDVDDILYDCNAYALRCLCEEDGIVPPLTIYHTVELGLDIALLRLYLRHGIPQIFPFFNFNRAINLEGNTAERGVISAIIHLLVVSFTSLHHHAR